MKQYQAAIKSLHDNIAEIEFLENTMKMKLTYKNGGTQIFKYETLRLS